MSTEKWNKTEKHSFWLRGTEPPKHKRTKLPAIANMKKIFGQEITHKKKYIKVVFLLSFLLLPL